MNGTYGTKKPAYITSSDVDIFYYYRPSRGGESSDFSGGFKLLDSNLLSTVDSESNDAIIKELPGMYDLRLPLDTFGSTGIYTIYIKPKEIYTTITDVSTLVAYPNVRGVILNASEFLGEENGSIFNNGSLVGYRIDYFDDDNTRSDIYRIITSNNRCEPLAQNTNSTIQKGVRYRFNDSSNLVFCTVTPSTAMSYRSTSLPYIGKTGQKIALVNTKFNPIMLEVEMVDHDIESISTMLEGAQVRNLDNGLITTFNDDGGIYHQAIYGNITDKNKTINHDFKLPNTDSIVTSEKDKLEIIKNNI